MLKNFQVVEKTLQDYPGLAQQLKNKLTWVYKKHFFLDVEYKFTERDGIVYISCNIPSDQLERFLTPIFGNMVTSDDPKGCVFLVKDYCFSKSKCYLYPFSPTLKSDEFPIEAKVNKTLSVHLFFGFLLPDALTKDDPTMDILQLSNNGELSLLPHLQLSRSSNLLNSESSKLYNYLLEYTALKYLLEWGENHQFIVLYDSDGMYILLTEKISLEALQHRLDVLVGAGIYLRFS